MNPIDLFFQGNPVIMTIITVAGGLVLYFAKTQKKNDNDDQTGLFSEYLLISGAACLLAGMAGQSISIVQVLNLIEYAHEVDPALITGGIRNTFIPLFYGAFWFVLAVVIRYLKK